MSRSRKKFPLLTGNFSDKDFKKRYHKKLRRKAKDVESPHPKIHEVSNMYDSKHDGDFYMGDILKYGRDEEWKERLKRHLRK